MLCDGRSKNNGEVLGGRTEGNKIVFFKGDDALEGENVNVRIERAEAFALYGEIV